MHLPSWLLSAELQQNLSNNLIRFFSDPKTSYLKTCQSLLVVEKYNLINIALFENPWNFHFKYFRSVQTHWSRHCCFASKRFRRHGKCSGNNPDKEKKNDVGT